MPSFDKGLCDRCCDPSRLWVFSPGDKVDDEEFVEEEFGGDNCPIVGEIPHCIDDASIILFLEL